VSKLSAQVCVSYGVAQSLSDPTDRLGGGKIPQKDPRVEFERIRSRLGIDRESIKEEEEIIESPDARTVITYDIQLDARSGAHKKITKFSTTMQQCHICLNYVPKLFACEATNCGALVCATDRRKYGTQHYCVSCYTAEMEDVRLIEQETAETVRQTREIEERTHQHMMDYERIKRSR